MPVADFDQTVFSDSTLIKIDHRKTALFLILSLLNHLVSTEGPYRNQ